MSIYHLHIPRTSGGYLRELIISNLKPKKSVMRHYLPLSEEKFLNADFVSGHYGITPCKYTDKTFTILRDPNEITFSYIKFLSLVYGEDEFNEDYIKKFIYDDKRRSGVTNVMTNFLSFDINIQKYNEALMNSEERNHVNRAINSWYLDLEKPNYKNAIQSVIDNKIFTVMHGSQTIYEDIAKFIGLEDFNYNKVGRIHESFADNDKLFEKYFDEIALANSEDIKLYDEFRQNANRFFKVDKFGGI